MVALAANIHKQNSSNEGESLRLEPLQRSMSDDIGRTVMWFTFGLAGFVLLIACANLANLQLVRTAARSRELAVRAALGAGRLRLLRHSLTESIIVALIGGVISLVIALWGVRFISTRLFTDLPGASVQLDYKVFGFALLCSLVDGSALRYCSGMVSIAGGCEPGVARELAWIHCRTISTPAATRAHHRRSGVCVCFAGGGGIVSAWLAPLH